MTEKSLVSPDYVTPAPDPDIPGAGMKIVGLILIWINCLALLITPLWPTSVSAGDYGQVANFTNMQMQSLVATISATFLIVGTLLYIGGAVIVEMAGHAALKK